jgi:hypothetical protein
MSDLQYLVCSKCGFCLPISKSITDKAAWRIFELAGWKVLELGRYACRRCS